MPLLLAKYPSLKEDEKKTMKGHETDIITQSVIIAYFLYFAVLNIICHVLLIQHNENWSPVSLRM